MQKDKMSKKENKEEKRSYEILNKYIVPKDVIYDGPPKSWKIILEKSQKE